MEKYLLIFTLIPSILAAVYKIHHHGELHGLNFEEIGSVKLITKYYEIKFAQDLTKIEHDIRIASEAVEMFKANFTNDGKYLKDMDEIKELIELKRLEILDITNDLESITVTKQSRKKRQIPNLVKDLDEMKLFIDNVSKNLAYHVKDLKDIKEINELVFNDFKKKIIRQEMHTRTVSIETRIEAIITLQTQQRLNNHLVSFEEFQERLSEINDKTMDNEELPYDAIHKYFYNIKATHEFNETHLIFTLNIPIVEKVPRTLYKIQEFPARFNSSLIVTKVGWKFISRSNDYAMFNSLDECLTSDSIYLCEPQSAIYKFADDCVTKALNEKIIDDKICDLKFVEMKKISIIRLSNEKFFYFSPKLENIKVICDGNEINEELFESGIIYLPSGCSASHENFKLVPTQMNKIEFNVEKVLETGFDAERLKKRVSGEISELNENVFFKNMEKLRDVVKEKEKPEIIPVLASSFNYWILVVLFLALLAAGIAAKCFKCALCL